MLDNIAVRGDNVRMNTTTATAPELTRWIDDYAIEIRGRRFTVEAHTDGLAGRSYFLKSAAGKPLLAVPAYLGDAHTYKVLAMSRFGGLYELRIAGNLVRLTDADGAGLRQI